MIFGKRIFLAPTWSIAAFVLVYVGSEVALILPFAWTFDFNLQVIMDSDLSEIASFMQRFSLSLVGVGALAYGIFRSTYFHPFFRIGYTEYVSLTPWSLGKPLPKGTPFFAWQDALVLLVFSLLALRAESLHWVSVVFILAAAGYSLPICAPLFLLEEKIIAYVIVYSSCLVIIAHENTLALCALAVVMVSLTTVGLRRSLTRLSDPEWDPVGSAKRLEAGARFVARGSKALYGKQKATEDLEMALSKSAVSVSAMPWPLNQLFPSNDISLTALDKILIALFLPWVMCLFFTASGIGPQEMSSEDYSSFFFALYGCHLILCLIRLAIYLSGYRAPISLLGRFATGQILIPRYDIVFLAPMSSMAALYLCYHALLAAGLDSGLAIGISVWIAYLILLLAGPSLEQWRFTGNHRLSPGMKANQTTEQI
jgi:hypothetical protein